MNTFEQLSRVDISAKINKKGAFSYLSWAHAVEELGKADPTATWKVKKFDGLPYLKTEIGYFVEVKVTVKGVSKAQIHPVLDNRNNPIAKPNSFQINTSIQRCLAKAIALHGLGLSLFYGEDILPELLIERQDQKQESEDKVMTEILKLIADNDSAGLSQVWHEMKRPEQGKVWGMFNTHEQNQIKELLEKEYA